MKNWLDKYSKEINANESQVSLPPNYIGEGASTQGRTYSPAWGGQFQNGGIAQDSLSLYKKGEARKKTLKGMKEYPFDSKDNLKETDPEAYQDFKRTGIMPTKEYVGNKIPGKTNFAYGYDNPSKSNTIIVNSKNDPRYKSYQDSLALYNSGEEMRNKTQKQYGLPKNRYTESSDEQMDDAYTIKGNKPISMTWSEYKGKHIPGGAQNWGNPNYKKPQELVTVKEIKKPSIVQSSPKIARIRNNIKPEGLVQSDFELEADVDIKVPVRTPKSYKVTENTNQKFGGRQVDYTSSIENIPNLPEMGPGNNRKITPVYQDGGYLEKLKENNPKLYKEIQRNNKRIESTNKWNQHFEEEKKKEEAKKWVQNSMQEAYKHPLMQPGYFTPEGMAIGAIQGAVKMGPDVSEGNYKGAAMDALMMLPLAPNAVRAAGPVIQRLGKSMNKVDNFLGNNYTLPSPPAELHIPVNSGSSSPIVENLRRAYHTNERFLTLQESGLLNRVGHGNRLDYAPQRIQNMFNLEKPGPDKMREVTQYLDKPQLQYDDITDLPLSKLTQLNELNADVRSRYITNGELAPEFYNQEILDNIDNTFRNYNRLNPEARLNPRITPRQSEILSVQPSTIDLRRAFGYDAQFNQGTHSPPIAVEPRNMSGYTKEQTMAMLPEDKAEKLAKLSSEEFDKLYVTPKGDIVPQNTNYTNPVVHDMHNDAWVESFNSNLPRLNNIIEANNTSGKPYTISSIDKNGSIKFDSEYGSSYFGTNITPGRFSGEIEDIANYQYMRDIPGISMANTSSGVFGPGGVHKGTKAYESINSYLKEMELGRVKAGFNSQTQYSRGLWENAVKGNKAFGYYGRPGTVHSIMRTVVPGAIGTGVAGAAALEQKQDGGIIDDDNGQWAHPGKVTRINSNRITMRDVNYPVLGVSDTGDTQMMYPEQEYKFKGKKVTEYPMAQNGKRQEQKSLQNLDNLTNFTNYNTKQPGGWLDNL